MPIAFNICDPTALRTYIDQYIRTNHNNEITAEEHNNIENGLLDFILAAPRNWNKAKICPAGAFTSTCDQAILIFKAGSTGTIRLCDNKWNEWVLYNNSGVDKQLIGPISNYRTKNGILRNYVSSGNVLVIAKGQDNIWYEIGGIGNGSGASVSFQPLQFRIGDVDSPMIAGDDTLVIVIADAITDSEDVSLDGTLLYVDLNDRISYKITYTSTTVTILFNQGVADGQVYRIKLATL